MISLSLGPRRAGHTYDVWGEISCFKDLDGNYCLADKDAESFVADFSVIFEGDSITSDKRADLVAEMCSNQCFQLVGLPLLFLLAACCAATARVG